MIYNPMLWLCLVWLSQLVGAILVCLAARGNQK